MAPVETALRLRSLAEGAAVAQADEDVRARMALDIDGCPGGVVADCLIDEHDNRVHALIVVQGDARVLVPIEAVVGLGEEGVRLDRTWSAICAGPRADDGATPETLERLYRHYGYTPFWRDGYRYPAYPYRAW